MSDRAIADGPRDEAALLADLLQLEYDALPTYGAAIAGLRRPDLCGGVEAFRADYEQHVSLVHQSPPTR